MAKQGSGSGRPTASTSISSDTHDLMCEICSEDGKHLEAEGFCVDCNDYMCRECVKGHRCTRISRNHVVQDKTHMPQQKPSPSVVTPRTGTFTEKCAHHPNRLVEYYCRDDRILGCSVCMTVNHRLCNSVNYISDLAEQLLDSLEYKQLINTLNSLKSKSDNVIKRTKQNEKKTKLWFSVAKNKIQDLRKTMNEAFDKFERDLNNKANTIQSADLKKMQDISDKGQTVCDEVEKMSNELQSLQDKNQFSQLFIHMINFEDKVETLHKLLAEADLDNSVADYTFEACSQVHNFLDDPSTIGTLFVQDTVRPKLSPSTTNPKLKKISSQPPSAQTAALATVAPITKDPRNMRAVLVKDIDVKTTGDTCICRISGSVVLPGNKLILADYSNQHVKLVNLQKSEVTSKLDISSGPWDITSIAADEVAVTLPVIRKIFFVKITDTLTLNREMSVTGTCRAILHNNGKLIVSFEKPGLIEIMALDGKVERRIEQLGRFAWPSHMTLSQDCETIYVADSVDGCVKTIPLCITVAAVYSDKKLDGPRGLTVDQYGRVLVCGGCSHNIHLLTPDLTNVKVLVDKLENPESLSYCHNTGRLFVGMSSDEVKVYQLS